MSSDQKHIVAVIPSWFDEQHHSRVRMERYIRWSKIAGFNTTIICSGNIDKIETSKFGQIFYFEDLLGYFREDKNINNIKIKKLKKIIRFIFRKLWIPDNGIMWSLRIFYNKKVRSLIADSDYVISTSPPESSHLGAFLLARKYNKKLLIDLRDGWLDDPLRKNLRRESIRKQIEKYIESKIINYSFRIFVSSNVWKDLLVSRYEKFNSKIFVLTNAYSTGYEKLLNESINIENNKPVLLYLGRLTASRSTQKIEYLLEPILKYSKIKNRKFSIKFIGKLVKKDFDGINFVSAKYEVEKDIIVQDPIEKSKISEELSKADGLLLLCISKASIPSKFYDYIPTSKPVLVITPEHSAVWDICESISQVFLIDSNNMDNSNDVLEDFWNILTNMGNRYNIPHAFSEDYVSSKYLNSISLNQNKST
jgi:hypothetical protein